MLRITASIFTFMLAPAFAGELPPVLSYQPNCTAEILSQQSLAKVLILTDKGHQQERDRVTQELIQQMRQLADDHQADAVLLKDISTKTRLAKNSGQSSVRRLLLSADLIRFCTDDRSLSARPAAFDENGAVPSSMSSLSFDLSSQPVPSPELEQAELPVRKDVSLAQGAYGFLPGISQAQVLQLAGEPDVRIRLKNGQQAWAYGRYLWLVFNNDLQQIHYQNRVLSGYGSNLAEPGGRFDRQWQLDGHLPYQAPLADVKQYLNDKQQPFQQNNKSELVLSNQQHQLILKFEHYQQVQNKPALLLLTEFSLMAKGEPYIALQPQPLPLQQLLPLLSPLALPQQQAPQRSQLGSLLALQQHQVVERKEKTWQVFGDHLQLQLNDDVVKAVRLAPALFLNNANAPLSKQMLQALGIPENGKQMLSRFADTQSLGDKLLLTLNAEQGSQSIELTVNPDSDNLEIEQVLIRYY